MIWGYPYFRKPPYEVFHVDTYSMYIATLSMIDTFMLYIIRIFMYIRDMIRYVGDVFAHRYTSWLVVWLPFFIFPYIGFLIIPIDFHIFQRGGYTTTNQQGRSYWNSDTWLINDIFWYDPGGFHEQLFPKDDRLVWFTKITGGNPQKHDCNVFLMA